MLIGNDVCPSLGNEGVHDLRMHISAFTSSLAYFVDMCRTICGPEGYTAMQTTFRTRWPLK